MGQEDIQQPEDAAEVDYASIVSNEWQCPDPLDILLNCNWPFGTANAPIQGFLRSLVPERAEEIQDKGNGVAVYPPYLEGGPPRTVTPDDFGGFYCTGKGCNHAPLGCPHIWEHRFRFCDLKNSGYVPPIAALRIRVPGGVPYESVERYLPRPNVRIGNVTSRWLEQLAREAMPERVRTHLGDLARILRDRNAWTNQQAGIRKPVGHPNVDIYDVAVLAILRMMDSNAYSALEFESAILSRMEDEDGEPLISSRFKNRRVNEAMTGYCRAKKRCKDPIQEARRLTVVLQEMVDHLIPYFRDITTVTMCDGMVLSTAHTDNARRGRSISQKSKKKKAAGKQLKKAGAEDDTADSEDVGVEDAEVADTEIVPEGETTAEPAKKRVRAVLATAHLMYDPRWAFICAYRLTWHQRGRGSGESPQFPYLLSTTLKWLPLVRTIMADMAYGSDRNHALCLAGKVWLVCALKAKQFTTRTKHLTREQAADIIKRNSAKNPLFRQLIPFRNLVEACNSALRKYAFPYLISRPDRPNMPLRKAEKLKENPNRAEAELDPENQAERDRVILEEQFVGRACENEMLCRQVISLIRAIIRAEKYYERTINLAFDTPFQPRAEDLEFSLLRPRLQPEPVAA